MTLFNPKLDVLVDNIETDKTGRYLLLQATRSLFTTLPSNCATFIAPIITLTKKCFSRILLTLLESVRTIAL